MQIIESPTKQKNRKKIVNTSKALFLKNGIGQTTMIDISKACKMERKTIYNYFESKELIAEYIFEEVMIKLFNEISSNYDLSGCTTSHEKFKRLFVNIVKSLFKLKEDIIYTVHYDYFFHNKANPDILSHAMSDFQQKEIYHIINEETKDGTINLRGQEPLEIFSMLGQAIMAFASRMFFRGHIIEEETGLKEEELYQYVDILMDGIKS